MKIVKGDVENKSLGYFLEAVDVRSDVIRGNMNIELSRTMIWSNIVYTTSCRHRNQQRIMNRSLILIANSDIGILSW